MQPRFSAEHPFHRRPPRPARPTEEDLGLLAGHLIRQLRRHCLPAGDPSDPRGWAA